MAICRRGQRGLAAGRPGLDRLDLFRGFDGAPGCLGPGLGQEAEPGLAPDKADADVQQCV